MLSGPGHEASAASNAMPGSRENVRAPRLLARNRAALPRTADRRAKAKGLRRRCDGAVPGRDRWHGSSVFSSPPPSRVLRMGQPYAQTGRSRFRTERERTPRTVEGSDGGAPTTRRARSSLASEPHTKRNAPRRRLAPKVTHTPRRLPRRLPRLRQGPKRHDRRLGAAAGPRGHGPEADRGGVVSDDQ